MLDAGDDLRLARDVHADRQDVIRGSETLGRCRHRVLIDVEQRNSGAVGQEALRDRQADAAGRAGDDGDAPVERTGAGGHRWGVAQTVLLVAFQATDVDPDLRIPSLRRRLEWFPTRLGTLARRRRDGDSSRMESATDRRPEVVLASNRGVRDGVVSDAQLERLRGIADFRFAQFDRPSDYVVPPPPDPDEDGRLVESLGEAAALIVSIGSPRITGEIMDACPRLRFIGELEGDRFASRIDVEAAWERGIKTVDTTNGSSYGVAEWALALAMIGLRNAGEQFRDVIERKAAFHSVPWDERTFKPDELTGRTVGLIGCGIIGRRLLELLEPFHTTTYVYDPYVPRELADAYGVTFTTLDNVLALPDVVICLAPITPATKGMLGEREFGLMRDGAVFVNVSRGAIVQTDALIAKLQEGSLIASLDVFDPEPIPLDSPIRDLRNVFLTPHTASATASTRSRNFRIMVDELERFFAGHETRYDLLPRTIANRTGDAPPGPA